jgi:HD-GYP domain-containing protein (c-di-GMP phosphodiesterase class II)/DNA-binding response OmpR family regulator
VAENAKILVVSNSPEVLQAVGRVVQPLRHLLFHAEKLADVKLRFGDLQPDLLIFDSDFEPVRDVDGMAALMSVDNSSGCRVQVMLMSRPNDPLRGDLVRSAQPNSIVDKPIDDLELSIEVRTLVRVRQLTAEAVRDRDVLNRLFELSTFSSDYTTTAEVLKALAGRVAEWMAIPHVVVTLGPADVPRVEAAQHSVMIGSGRTLVDRRHRELVKTGQVLQIATGEGVLSGDDPASLPYCGIPLRATDGEILGVLHAWGGDGLPTGEKMRILTVAAERISTEIQLRDSNRRLEEMVESRTGDLTAALQRLRSVNNQLLEASRDTINRLARAAEYRDGDTGDHVERMSSYAQTIAHQLGMSAEQQALIKLAAPMHDVGKIGIPDAILLKAGKLTPDEYDVMKEHPTIGAQILSGSRSKLLQMAERIAATHHEKWDGTGYPAGLAGNDIPLEARIVTLADVFDALTSPRVYKDAWGLDEAVGYVVKLSGSHFDPRVVCAFEQCIDRLIDVRSRHSTPDNDASTLPSPVDGSIHHAKGVP